VRMIGFGEIVDEPPVPQFSTKPVVSGNHTMPQPASIGSNPQILRRDALFQNHTFSGVFVQGPKYPLEPLLTRLISISKNVNHAGFKLIIAIFDNKVDDYVWKRGGRPLKLH
jgi:hypothetical protein